MSLVPIPATPEEWHALRARHIGASEVAILFGCAPDYAMGIRALWEAKAGRVPPPPVDNPRVRWGLLLEDAICAYAEEQEGWRILPGQYASQGGLGATLDRIIEAPGPNDEGFTGPGCLELKNADWLAHKRIWGGEPPLHILLQLQAQLAATGYSWGAIACLVGGNDLRIYRYAARPALASQILTRVAAFWQSVREGKPPRADGSDATYKALIALSPTVADEPAPELEGDNEAPGLCARYLELAAQAKAIDEEKAETRNRLLEKLGEFKWGFVPGFRLSQAVSAAKPDRPAKPGEIIRGRAESRRIIVQEREDA